jgi:hypothetical protein
LIDEILDRGVVGSLREIRDAIDTPGKDEFGGAVAQAWSLAEMQRTLYEDYLGVYADIPNGRIRIAPMLPQALTRLAARVPAGRGTLHVVNERTPGALRTHLEPKAGCEGITARVVLTASDGKRWAADLPLSPPRPHDVQLEGERLTVNGTHVESIELDAMPAHPGADFRFSPPRVQR